MPGYKNLIYTNAEELFNPNSTFTAYRDAIHITATNSLKTGMMKSNSSLNRWITGPVISFAELMKYVGGNWTKSKTSLKQFTLLSKELRVLSAEKSEINSKLFGAVDKNQELLLKTIRLLCETGYTSAMVRDKLPIMSQQEHIFLELWKAVENDSAYSDIHNWFQNLSLSPKREFRTTLRNLFEDFIKDEQKRIKANIPPNEPAYDIVYKRIRQGKKSILVLHGFYFLLPVQKRLFDILSRKFDILHVINYQPGYAHGFQTVEQFLQIQQHGYIRAMQHPYPVNYHAGEFLCAINGSFTAGDMATDEQDIKKVNYFEFHNLQQFRRYTEANDERYVSPRAGEVKEYLAPIEQAEHKKLSEHPLGSFLVNIHRINRRKFDTASAQYIDSENVNYTLLREIFASGYLFVDGVNVQKAMRTLDLLREITNSFTTFSEWTTCIDKLIVQKKQAEHVSENKYSYRNDEHRMYSFYHEVIGYFYSTHEELLFVKDGILKIKDLFELLFQGTEINISQYVEILEGHITNYITPSLSEELDREIAENILSVLKDLKSDTLNNLDRKDLMQGLQYFLAQNAEVENEYETDLHGYTNYNTTDVINSLLNSDGLQFEDNRVVHFGFMDNEAFPASQSFNIWPLSKDSFEHLCNDNIYLHQLQLRKELEVEIACYQFYLIMTNAVKVNFSIVRRLDERKHLKRSFYLNFLTLIKGSDKQLNDLLKNEDKTDYFEKNVKFNKRLYEKLPGRVFNRCPKRFVYSFLLDRRPVFYEGFHEPFLYQQLISHDQARLKLQDRLEEYRSWFPHWSETKKTVYQTAAIEYAQNNPGVFRQENTILDESEEYFTRTGLNLFGSRSKGEIRKTGEENVNGVPFTRPGENCKYCTFQFICAESNLHMK
ncbi:hypothetical protein [Lysinibacillus sp. 3P01SB]|uniref:hypothetical protein n=1 Tax=Lysinibacillus sp. 3P01SB TaxID=3132284 RepID=UPI0039A6946F